MNSLTRLLERCRVIDLGPATGDDEQTQTISFISSQARGLETSSHRREANILRKVQQKCTTPTNFGGMGLRADHQLDGQHTKEVLYLCEARLQCLISADAANHRPGPSTLRPLQRRGMTVAEKYWALHHVEYSGSVKPGQVIRVAVEWIIASELSWGGMRKT